MHYKSPDNSLHFLDDDSFVYLLPAGSVQITDEEATTIQTAQAQAVLNALTYADKRRAEYPSFGDQMDKIFNDGLDAWKAEIQAVKDKYPK